MPKFKVGDAVKLKSEVAKRSDLPDTPAKVIGVGDELGIQTEYKIKHDGLKPCIAFEEDLEIVPDLIFESKGMTVGGKFHKTVLTVSILGTTYTIQELSVSEDISLKDCDGYCDRTDKRIVVAKKEADCDLGDFEQHRKKTMRHEVLHAFFNESGLAENFENKLYGIPETLVDWFAIQSPKIYKTFAELDIL